MCLTSAGVSVTDRRRKIDPAFLTYLVAGMVFIHSQEPSGANVRYELALFPVFLLLSRLMAGSAKACLDFGQHLHRRPDFVFLSIRHLALGGLALVCRFIRTSCPVLICFRCADISIDASGENTQGRKIYC